MIHVLLITYNNNVHRPCKLIQCMHVHDYVHLSPMDTHINY